MKTYRYTGDEKLVIDGRQVFPGDIISRDSLDGLQTNKFVELETVVTDVVRKEVVEIAAKKPKKG